MDLNEILKQRAASGEPKAMLLTATTNDEAQAAIEAWLGHKLERVDVTLVTPRNNAAQMVWGCARRSWVKSEVKSWLQIRVQLYSEKLKGRDKLHSTTELVFTKESAREFAKMLLEAAKD